MHRPSATYVPNLTGVRGLAAAWVFALHGWSFSGAPALVLPVPGFPIDFSAFFRCGYLGVDLFFVLSGFLLAMPFHRAALDGRSRPSLLTFWNHRCRRVLPAYWLQLAILAIVLVLAGNAASVTSGNLAAHALLLHNLWPVPVTLLNPVYWSMPVEWDFYVILPLLAWLVARCRWPLALSFAVAFAIAFRVLCYWSLSDTQLARFVGYGDVQQLPARVDQFFIGICAAWIAATHPLTRRAANGCLLAGAGVIVAMVFIAAPRGDFLVRVDVPYVFFHHTITALGFGLLVLGAAGPTRTGAVLFANRPMTWLGLISYSLYLWHYPLLSAAQALGWLDGAHAPRWAIVAGVLVPIVLVVSALSYRFVEKPFLRSSRAPRLASPPSATPAQPLTE